MDMKIELPCPLVAWNFFTILEIKPTLLVAINRIITIVVGLFVFHLSHRRAPVRRSFISDILGR